jgi:effector-binding domain-containing protein
MLETAGPLVALKRVDSFHVAYLPHRGPSGEIGLTFRRLFQILREERIHALGPPLAIHYREPDDRNRRRPWSEAAVPVAEATMPHRELRTKPMPASDVASLIYDGPPARYLKAYEGLREWIRAQGYERAGPIREIFAKDLSELPPGILYAEVQVPVRRAHRE